MNSDEKEAGDVPTKETSETLATAFDQNAVQTEDNQSQVGLSDDTIREITDSLHEPENDNHIAIIEELSDADTADLLQKISGDDRQKLLEENADEIDPLTFSYMDPALRKTTLETMSATQVAEIIAALDSDDALDLIENLEEDFQQDIIKQLSAKTRIAIEEGLTFPEDSAGRLMQREVVAVPQFWTVGKVIDYLRAAAPELPTEFHDIIVIDPLYHVVGEVPLNRVLRSRRTKKIEELTLDELHIVPAEMDQEEAAPPFPP